MIDTPSLSVVRGLYILVELQKVELARRRDCKLAAERIPEDISAVYFDLLDEGGRLPLVEHHKVGRPDASL